MHVLLFDIDGTLIRSGGAGKAAMEGGLTKAFGITEIQDVVPYGGRTDEAIVRDLLRVHGIEVTPENIVKLQQAYQNALQETLHSQRGEVCRGILELMPRLTSSNTVTLGLLTGNVRSGAERKLLHYNLWHYFPFGGFADDTHDRSEVARRAVREAEKHLGREVERNRVWVIGDTPHDVKCARDVNARAVAVGTGWHSMEELAASNPDFLVEDLSQATELLQAWGIR
jgi:phosphoglycolate phosphatase-like HAD superfamily hydrolase